jgi:hypothetical protein
MNRFVSHPNQKNRIVYEGFPLQGISEVRWAGGFEFLVTDPPMGRPVGGLQSSYLMESHCLLRHLGSA